MVVEESPSRSLRSFSESLAFAKAWSMVPRRLMEELFAVVLVFAPSSAMAGLDDMLLLSSLQATIEKAVAKANKNGNQFFIVFSFITIFNLIEKSPSGRKKLYVKKNL